MCWLLSTFRRAMRGIRPDSSDDRSLCRRAACRTSSHAASLARAHRWDGIQRGASMMLPWRLVPALLRSVGFDPGQVPFCWRRLAVHRRGPIPLSGRMQALQHDPVYGGPRARLLPPAQTAPTGHSRAASHFGRQILPGRSVRSTNKVPVSAAWLSTRGRPPFRRGGSGGDKGTTCDHRSSESRCLDIPLRSESGHLDSRSC